MSFIEVDRLRLASQGPAAATELSFGVEGGVTFVRGGEGRGKSSLMRLLAGATPPLSGTIHWRATSLLMPDPSAPSCDAMTGLAWLDLQRASLPDWDARAQPAAVHGYGLEEHITKPLYMLSTGSRRKVGLVAATVGRAQVTLLDMPYAALDAPSRQVLTLHLNAEALARDRAWVLADYELPPGLTCASLAAFIDLGD